MKEIAIRQGRPEIHRFEVRCFEQKLDKLSRYLGRPEIHRFEVRCFEQKRCFDTCSKVIRR